jgi:hypothetical protein
MVVAGAVGIGFHVFSVSFLKLIFERTIPHQEAETRSEYRQFDSPHSPHSDGEGRLSLPAGVSSLRDFCDTQNVDIDDHS